MAGLLTFPQSALPSQPCCRPVTFSKQTLCLRGLQLQVQFRTLTGFPCIAVVKATRLPYLRRKGTTFSHNHQPNRKNIPKQKRKRHWNTRKTPWFPAPYWKRDPVGTSDLVSVHTVTGRPRPSATLSIHPIAPWSACATRILNACGKRGQ